MEGFRSHKSMVGQCPCQLMLSSWQVSFVFAQHFFVLSFNCYKLPFNPQLAPTFSNVRQKPVQLRYWYLCSPYLGVERRGPISVIKQTENLQCSTILWFSVLAESRGLLRCLGHHLGRGVGYRLEWVPPEVIRWVTLGSLGTVMFEDEAVETNRD